MGEPVRIVDLARDMIRLSGLQEGTDIEIEYTGIRPGEKLFEEMFFTHEVAQATEHPKILRARNGHHEMCTDLQIGTLIEAAHADANVDRLRVMLRSLVPFAEGTPQNGVPSIVDPPMKRKGRPSGEMTAMV
jgi:FlaA1/EpsC-like NDP-sugar epimerase